MGPTLVNHFLWGALALGCWVAGLFFLRSWKASRDRFFLLFTGAFWILSLNWIVLAFVPDMEGRPHVYLVRLAAFVLIIFAIIDKNRTRSG